MKHILICILFIISLSSCKMSNISNTVYISSYSLNYVDGEYEAFFYLPSSKSITEEDTNSEVYVVRDSLFSNLFISISKSSDLVVNFGHVRSVILTMDFLSDDNIEIFLDYIKKNNNVDFNFYMFVTSEDPKEIYEVNSLNDTSSYYTIFTDPTSDIAYEIGQPYHFFEFASKFYDLFYTQIIPVISLSSNWENKDGETNVAICNSICLYNDSKVIYDLLDISNLKLLFDIDNLYIEEDFIFKVINYKFNIEKLFNLKIEVSGEYVYGTNINKIMAQQVIEDGLYEVISYFYNNNIDYLSLLSINNKYDKLYDIDDIIIDVSLK